MNTMTVSRRAFLKVASVAGGGLMLGFRIPSGDEGSAVEMFAPNAWLRVAPNGIVTVIYGRAEMGQGSSTALPMIVAEELEADWKKVQWEQADAHPTKYGSMSTGGSRSVRGFWTELRTAGATAKAMLIGAAARQWAVDPASCRAHKGAVSHPTGKSLTYGELASAAAKLPVPENVTLKDRREFTIIGKRLPRFDIPPKVFAETRYCSDMTLPGMVTASIERCPTVAGTLIRFDASKSKEVRGVKDVVATDSGVAVIADTTWAAFKGREALVVTWEKGPWAGQSSEAIRSQFEARSSQAGTVSKQAGDAQSAFRAAVTKLEAVYSVPFGAHATMEPMTCIADVRNDRCEVWAPTQSPQQAQNAAAKILDLPLEKVTVHVLLSGSAFGRRLESDYVEDAVRVSKAVGKPAKVVWTRSDDMKHDWYRPATTNVVKGGLDQAGTPVAWMHRIVGPDSRGLVIGGSTPPYDLPNLLVDYHLIETGVRLGAWRSVGPSQNAFVIESFIDELAHAARRDPLEFRRSLMSTSVRLRKALEYVGEKAGWGTPLPVGVARGISAVESFGTAVAQVAEVSVSKGVLKILRIVTALDCGPYVNPDTIEAQIDGAVGMALGAAMKDEITVKDGQVVQSNFDDYRIFTIADLPKTEVHIMETDNPVGGIGEPALPPTTPAVCNAIFAASGVRIRTLPFNPNAIR